MQCIKLFIFVRESYRLNHIAHRRNKIEKEMETGERAFELLLFSALGGKEMEKFNIESCGSHMASPLTAKQIGRDDDLVGNGGSQGNRNKTRVRSLGEKADYAGALGIIKIFSLSIGTENVAHMRGTRDNVPWCWNALHCWDEISSGTSAPSGLIFPSYLQLSSLFMSFLLFRRDFSARVFLRLLQMSAKCV
jgi:hypothetical protein